MRSRNIKPGFFHNDELAMCSWPARLLFIGLWCIADRKGLLEDRPLRIKGKLFPFDNIDISEALDELVDHEFVVRYEADGRKCLWIPQFLQHQNPHPNESESILPEPISYQGVKCLRPRRETHKSGIRNQESENQKEGECEGESAAKSGDPMNELRPWLVMWNRLRAGGFVAVGVNAESPSEAVRKAWNKANETPEVRDLLADPDLVEKAIRTSSFCNAGWFTLAKLLYGKNKTGEFIIARLMEGGYREKTTTKPALPGKQFTEGATCDFV